MWNMGNKNPWALGPPIANYRPGRFHSSGCRFWKIGEMMENPVDLLGIQTFLMARPPFPQLRHREPPTFTCRLSKSILTLTFTLRFWLSVNHRDPIYQRMDHEKGLKASARIPGIPCFSVILLHPWFISIFSIFSMHRSILTTVECRIPCPQKGWLYHLHWTGDISPLVYFTEWFDWRARTFNRGLVVLSCPTGQPAQSSTRNMRGSEHGQHQAHESLCLAEAWYHGPSQAHLLCLRVYPQRNSHINPSNQLWNYKFEVFAVVCIIFRWFPVSHRSPAPAGHASCVFRRFGGHNLRPRIVDKQSGSHQDVYRKLRHFA